MLVQNSIANHAMVTVRTKIAQETKLIIIFKMGIGGNPNGGGQKQIKKLKC